MRFNEKYKFPYGAMYAWNLSVFTVIMAYSITCPIIVPAGLVYLILKHLVDKHNLYYACGHSYIDRQVHLEAVNLAMAAPIICLIWLYLFSALQEGFMALTTLFTLGVLVITITIRFTRICYGLFKQPISKKANPDKEPQQEGKSKVQAHSETADTDRETQDFLLEKLSPCVNLGML
ncbi:mechanosensitive cation channel TMEM63A-like [Alosa pseudoharengus]|uniref:mechanosensitive cation channel TMEM63A-like n=1 Tax=Alosa pseudoharengus TaxID=34774 RepID=UPI003F8A9BF6